MFFAYDRIEHKAEYDHGHRDHYPAEAQVIKGQGTADPADKAQGDPHAVNCVENADNRCAKDRKGIDKSVAADKFIAQTQYDQHNGNGIDRIEDGHRNAQDRIKTLIADRKGKDRDAQYKFVVADALKQGGKILGDRVDQTYAGRQTSEGKDRRQQNGAKLAEKLIYDLAQRPCAVFLDGINTAGLHAHIGKHYIHRCQNGACGNTRKNRMFDNAAFFLYAEIFQSNGDHKAEVKGGNGVHCLITFAETFQKGGGLICRLRLCHPVYTFDHKADKQKDDQSKQCGRQKATDTVYQFAGVKGKPGGDGKNTSE